ncbi:TPA: helix-turn-helix transcriptional regulator [Streptococcus suis]|nr:helix-turn-helix transcriptional regulator [Streptococcus suis]
MIKTNFAVLMAERGLKIADVYEDTGISKTTLMALAENTGKGVQFDTVDKLCNYLGIELKDFFVYSPYIWKVYYKDDYEYKEEGDSIIAINLKSIHSERIYIAKLYFFSPKHIDSPIDDESVKLWVRLSLDEESGNFGQKEFYNFVSSLPVSFQTHFYNDVIETIKKHYLIFETAISAYRYDYHPTQDYLTEIRLNKNDKVLISFFDNYGSSHAPKNIQIDKIIKLT